MSEADQIADARAIDRLVRSLGPFGFVAVDIERVDMLDLIDAGNIEGLIVRVRGNPHDAIAYFPAPDAPTLGCVAGWISEEL